MVIHIGIHDIIWHCRCYPVFFETRNFNISQTILKSCTGEKLYCANQRRQFMGLDIKNENNNFTVSEALKNPNRIGNVSKKSIVKCLPSCRGQEIIKHMSYATYPSENTFFYDQKFCYVATHIWQRSCLNEDRKYFLDRKHPQLCQELSRFKYYFEKKTVCANWPHIFLQNNTIDPTEMSDEVYQYGRKNLAFIHVIFQSPYAEKITRDAAMTFTSYVANAGGLLGLFLGFSFISTMEILYWCCCCCIQLGKKYPY